MLFVKFRAYAAPRTTPTLRQHPAKQSAAMGRPPRPRRMAITAPSAPPPDTPKV